jgi:subtilisin family serine protease
MHDLLKARIARTARFVVSLLLVTALLSTPSLANGPIPPPEVRWIEGQLLIQVAERVDLYRVELKAGSVTPGLDELNLRFGVVAADLVMPQYRPTAMEAIRRSTKGRSTAEFQLELMDGLGRWMLLEADPTSDIEAMAKAYAALDEVVRAEPNYIMQLVEAVPEATKTRQTTGRANTPAGPPTKAFIPNDPDFGSQWGLTYINAPDAWDITMGDPSQVIAIIDTGVDLDHPDLANKIWSNIDEDPGDGNGDGCPGFCGIDDDGDGLIDEDRDGVQMGEPGWDSDYADDDDENSHIDDFLGWDWISSGEGYEDNDPQDDNGHGTHCAGIAAAETHNSIGGAGACPLCTVMPLKAFQSSGIAAFSDIAKAVDYAAQNGAGVISMSFSSSADSGLVRDALSLAFTRSVLVAAAGNDKLSRITPFCSLYVLPFYPAHYSWVLGVEAVDDMGIRAGFSNCQYELQNPGVGIHSTVLDDTYTSWSGTSMATPYVAGTAGLLRSFHAGDPSWGPDLFFGQLIQTGGNSLSALTLTPVPDLQLEGFEVVDNCAWCDGDGVADSGESVELVVTIRNLWGDATGVSGTLSTIDPLATVTTPGSTWGSVGPAAFDDNADNPFEVDIDPTTGNNRDIVFDLVVNAGNGGNGIAGQIVLTVQRGVEKGGILAASETWIKDNLYLVTDNLLVMPGATLTVEAGTRIQVDDRTSITVRGELIARGSVSERIVFTGNPDRWAGIHFASEAVPAAFNPDESYASGSILEFCIIEGTEGVPNEGRAGLYLDSAPFLHKNIFRDNSGSATIETIWASARIEKNLFTAGDTGRGAVFMSPARISHNTFAGCSSGGGAGTLYTSPGSLDTWFFSNNLVSNTPYDFTNRSFQGSDIELGGNYWGTTNPSEIAEQIYDFFDNPVKTVVLFDPPLALPDPDAPPIIADITLSPPSPVSAQTVTFTVTFSKNMDITAPAQVFFGPSDPYTSHPADLNPVWLDPLTFEVEADITVFTGDGNQTITVWNAEDLEGFPIPSGDHRFGFEIVTTGTSAAQLTALGDVGHVDLSWFASALPDVAGYNLYRGDVGGGPYMKVNAAIVADVIWVDNTAMPGVPYYYIYRVVTTDLLEGPDSDEASAAALDDILPVITHTPVTTAPAGLPITIDADITDNVATPTASLFHRELGSSDSWDVVTMINATGDQHTANIPDTDAVAPGREYYLEASDGVNTVQHGTPGTPHPITIVDQPTIDTVTPDHGPLTGSTPVTITGTNFQSGCTVEIGGAPATSIVVVDPQTITCDTAAHYPAVVDVTVTNPNLAAGTITRAYTYDGTPTIVELPTTAHDRLSTTTLGVSTPGAEGLISATLEFSYDPAVLSVQGAGAGSLTGGWTVSANTGTPGTVRLSLAGTTPVTGLGTIAEVTVDVIGNPAAVTVLTWVQVELNEGAIPETAVDGQVTVNNAFDVAGTVSYYVDARAVEGATMTLDGSASYSQPTAADGSYAIDNVPSDTYTLTPTKSDAVGVDDISALDASFVLQHDAGLMTLDPQQQTAGDVNGSGTPTAFDASYILQYSVGLIGLPFPGAGSVWAFDPQNRSYTPLNTNQTGQNFDGILIGDPTGNWNSGAERGLDGAGALSFPRATTCGTPLQVSLDLVDLAPGTDVYSVDLTILYDPRVVSVSDVAAGLLATGWSVTVNLQTPGELRVAMAGATSIVITGELLALTVEPLADGSSPLWLDRAQLNEDRVITAVTHGRIFNCPLFEDGFESGTTGSWMTN